MVSQELVYNFYLLLVWLAKKTRNPEQIFMPFEEGDQTMGLPLTYRLAKNMRGILSFSQKDKEFIFTVTLPVSDK